MLNKPVKNKKKKCKTPKPDGDCCVGCGSSQNLEVHHVYFGSGTRSLSSEYKCVVWLCAYCHRGNNGVHGFNKELDLMLKRKHQEILEHEMSREEFIRLFGRSYL